MAAKKQNDEQRVLAFLKSNKGTYFKQKKIAKALEIRDSHYRKFKQLLKQMADEGKIQKSHKNSFTIPDPNREIAGVISYSSRGFGFLMTDEGNEIFINAYDIAPAFHGDRVLVEKFRKQYGDKPEGRVIRILNRSEEPCYAVLRQHHGQWLAVLESPGPTTEIHILSELGPENEGLVAELTNMVWDHPKTMPRAEVAAILGDPGNPHDDIEIIKKMYNFTNDFPKAVEEELKHINEPDINSLVSERLDLRDETIFTIDPQNAKDFDDAVSLKRLPQDNWQLGVHIADVSHYIKAGTALDKEALRRGTSVYLADSVVPMLPEKLSNELCSLQPEKEKLSFSVLIELDDEANVVNYQLHPSIIKSKKRFAYEEAHAIIEAEEGPFAEELILMKQLSGKLSQKRKEMGSIDFDIPEPIFFFGKDGIPHEIRPSERLNTHRLIEEFMLLANRCVADFIVNKHKARNWPFLYRIHEAPAEESVKGLYHLLSRLGLSFARPKHFRPLDLGKILEEIEQFPFKNFIERVSLRAMTKAKYSDKCLGHFGLAFPHYSHFTSPIRRYPDLIIHRLLKIYLQKKVNPETVDFYRSSLGRIGDVCSASEVRAMEAEREFVKIKQIRFIARKVGKWYDGVITGVMEFGFFVEITNYLVEGLVHVRTLKDDYYQFDENLHCLTGKRSDRKFQLGDSVKVQVKEVSVKERRVDFIWGE